MAKKSSTDGFSAKEKKLFQEMLVSRNPNWHALQASYDNKQYKAGLKNCDILSERYPDHPGT